MGLHSALKANRPGSAGPREGAHSRALCPSLRIPCPWVPRLQTSSALICPSRWKNHRKQAPRAKHVSVLPGCLIKAGTVTGTRWARCFDRHLHCQSGPGVKTWSGKRRAFPSLLCYTVSHLRKHVFCPLLPWFKVRLPPNTLKRDCVNMFLCLMYRLCLLWLPGNCRTLLLISTVGVRVLKCSLMESLDFKYTGINIQNCLEQHCCYSNKR